MYRVCSEHVCVHKLRQSKDFIPELTYVIEVDGEVVGSIFYSKSRIVGDDGKEYPMITFGPVSILPGFHRKGLGRKLIIYSIDQARKDGHKAIVSTGYPYHYETYGFKGGKAYGISMPDGKFYKGLLVLPLYEGALEGITGYAEFSESLEPTEEEIEEYDRGFPYKEKKVMPSQEEFETVSMMLDED